MADHDPVGAAKEAAAVQAVQVLFALGLVCLSVGVEVIRREARGPDFGTTTRMGLAKRCERGWAVAAGWCWRRAERFRVEYEGAAGVH